MTSPSSSETGSRRILEWLLPGGVLLLALVGPLLVPGQVLTEGDLPFFHLPLRHALVSLTEAGELPAWNPWIHGGQPTLSNPNYAAFYPPTWLAALSPAYSLQLLLVLHAGLALAGAWRLARRLGASPPAAGLAATGFAAAPWFLSLGDTINLYCGVAWIPWTLVFGLDALASRNGPSTRAPAFLCAATLALELLAGEPVVPLLGAIAVGALALAAPGPVGGRIRTLGLVGALASGLAAVQLLPTSARLADSPRSAGLAMEDAATWSAPPARLVELAFPWFWGDPQRDEEGLYFGWSLHDRRYPYVESLYAGLPLLILGLAALGSPKFPLRAGWTTMVATGLLLGLGRHAGLFPVLAVTPPFSWIRYPEKFLLLMVVGLVFSGAMAVDRIAERPAPGSRWTLRLALGLSLATLVASLCVGAWWHLTPGAADRFLQENGGLAGGSPLIDGAKSFLLREALLGALSAAALVGALLLAYRRPRTLPLSLLLLTSLQFAHYGQGRNPTLPSHELLAPPPLAAKILGGGEGRLFTDVGFQPDANVHPRVGPVGFHQVLGKAGRLDPYVGLLWGIPYVFHDDYDLMATRWSRHAEEIFLRAWPTPRPSREILESWRTRHLLTVIDPESRSRLYRQTGRVGPPARLHPLRPLPRVRSVRRLASVPLEGAWSDLEARSFSSREADACVGPPRESLAVSNPPRVDRLEGHASSLDIELEPSDEMALLVVASTFDRGWRARLPTGERLELCPTALGQIALSVPPGTRRVELRYGVPWLGAGAVTSSLTLLVGLWLRGRP